MVKIRKLASNQYYYLQTLFDFANCLSNVCKKPRSGIVVSCHVSVSFTQEQVHSVLWH